MPRYDYDCPKHGRFERIAGVNDSVVPCTCGRPATRRAVYVEQGVIFKGGGFTKSVLPPPGPDAQAELHKEVRKRGWDGDRAISEMRKNVVETETGKAIDFSKMTKQA